MGLTQTKPLSELPPLPDDNFSTTIGIINSSCEDLHVGTSLGGSMSPVRRFFCLLTTFDFVFTVLLWIIVIMLSGYNGRQAAFEKEVVSYSIDSSLFDIVMLSAWRFTLIILAYALFRISHWWIIAITTAGSGAFVIAKVFMYDWHLNEHISALAIALLVSSFVISWGEAWFLDFRVIPSETKASYLLARYINERTPLIPGPSFHYCHSEDGSAFFSPPGSDGGSDIEYERERQRDGDIVSEVEWIAQEETQQQRRFTHQERLYKKQVEDALEEGLGILKSEEWKTEKMCGDDVVQSQYIPKYGKVYKFVGIVNMSTDKMLEEMFFKVDRIHLWNPTIKSVKILHKIDYHSDVAHVIASEAAGGLVSSRDFVNLRTWQKRGNLYISGSVSVSYPDMPPQSMYTRGEQGPNVYVWTPVDGEPNKCHMQWLLNTNLKGWLPQYLIDQTLSSRLLECIKYLRDRAEHLSSAAETSNKVII